MSVMFENELCGAMGRNDADRTIRLVAAMQASVSSEAIAALAQKEQDELALLANLVVQSEVDQRIAS